MPDVWSNLEVSDEEMGSLSEVEDKQLPTQTDSEPKPSQEVSEVEEKRTETKVDDPVNFDNSEEEYEFQIDNETFGLDSVLEWKKDSENKIDWSKSNTQKAQTIAKGGRLLTLLDNDEEFRSHVKDYFYGDDKEFTKFGLDSKYGVDMNAPQESEPTEETYEESNPAMDEMYDRIDALEDEKLGRSIGDRYDDLRTNNPDFFREEQDGVGFLQFCNSDGVYTDGDIDMEASFKLWSYEKVMTADDQRRQLYENKLRNGESTISNSEIGAKEVRSGETPKNYKDINMDDPDISRYFNT